jgi:transcriptional regulator of acetoin/glycerol metabolism
VERQLRPSGVRELREVLQRALAGTVSDVLETLELPRKSQELPPETEEERLIREVLRTTGGNRTAAAKLLGMSRVTLWKRLKAMPPEPA